MGTTQSAVKGISGCDFKKSANYFASQTWQWQVPTSRRFSCQSWRARRMWFYIWQQVMF